MEGKKWESRKGEKINFSGEVSRWCCTSNLIIQECHLVMTFRRLDRIDSVLAYHVHYSKYNRRMWGPYNFILGSLNKS